MMVLKMKWQFRSCICIIKLYNLCAQIAAIKEKFITADQIHCRYKTLKLPTAATASFDVLAGTAAASEIFPYASQSDVLLTDLPSESKKQRLCVVLYRFILLLLSIPKDTICN